MDSSAPALEAVAPGYPFYGPPVTDPAVAQAKLDWWRGEVRAAFDRYFDRLTRGKIECR